MDAQVIELIAIVLGSNVVAEVVKEVIKKLKKESPEQIALRALCERELDTMLHDWLHDDVRTADDWRIIENLYTGYKGLDGNGEIKKLYEEASDLKTTE